jgi:HEAT repeat protein
MVRIARGLTVVGILLATARGAEPDPLELVVQDLKEALKQDDSIAAANALAKASEVRWKYEDEKLEPLLNLVGAAIKHKDPTIASVATRTLAQMRVPGSSSYLSCRLAVPDKVGATYWDVHLAAIQAAGELHERESISPLLKLVEHPKLDMAVAAAVALGRYAALVPKERLKLIRRVASTLGRFEKKRPKKMQDQIRVERVKSALIDCVRRLTHNRELASASDVRAWLREARKSAGPT